LIVRRASETTGLRFVASIRMPADHNPVAWANEQAVVRLPGFLSGDEIEALHSLASRLPIMRGNAKWHTKYLHARDIFRTHLPALHDKVVDAMAAVDKGQGWGLLDGGGDGQEANVRCAEYHHVETGGGLTEEGHKDTGSLVTIDFMLSNPGTDFTGGRFYTHEPTSGEVEGATAHEYHTHEKGDALVFVSHKHHVRRTTSRVALTACAAVPRAV
jgi:hypothetical protein